MIGLFPLRVLSLRLLWNKGVQWLFTHWDVN